MVDQEHRNYLGNFCHRFWYAGSGDIAMKGKGNGTILESYRGRRRIAMAVALTPALAAWFVWGPLGIISYVGGLFNWVGSYAILLYLVWVIPAAVRD